MFDIGLIYRSNHNFGANLTHFALAKTLSDMGKSILMIDMPKGLPLSLPLNRDDPYELYVKPPYETIDILEEAQEDYSENIIKTWRPDHIWDLKIANNYCDTFLLGSDQLWRSYFLKGSCSYTLLNWVECNKRIISYATSFGTDHFEGDDDQVESLHDSLGRFDAISVREKSGKRIVNELFGLDCFNAIDPVFLCDKSHYFELINSAHSIFDDSPFYGFYILDFNREKLDLLDSLENENKTNVRGYSDAMVDISPILYNNRHIIKERKVEDWLYIVSKCDFFITDSFHGLCFAIIFQKPFIVLSNENSHRGFTRIYDLLCKLNLQDRIIRSMDYSSINLSDFIQIDYSGVDQTIDLLCQESFDWLDQAILGKKKTKEYTKYYEEWNQSIDLEQYKFECQKIRLNKLLVKKTGKREIDAVIWGTGAKFRELIQIIQDCCTVRFLVDSDCRKHNIVYCNKYMCLSPEILENMNKDFILFIMIENQNTVNHILSQIHNYGISNYITYREFVE